MRVLILQHIRCETPGTYIEVLRDRGADVTTAELDEGDSLPDWRDFDAVVCMGGPMNVDDDLDLPWLTGEKRLIAEAVRAGVPFWGVCLGAQLLARALGAAVRRGPVAEVGVGEIIVTDEGAADPVIGSLPRRFRTLQWHGDTFDVPADGVLLASSGLYRNQAFRFGTLAYGLQFHLEVSPKMCADWAEVPEYASSLRAAFGVDGVERLLEEVTSAAEEMRRHALGAFSTWLDAARVKNALSTGSTAGLASSAPQSPAHRDRFDS